VSSLVVNWTECPLIPPEAFTVFTQALYTSSSGTSAPPNGPEHEQTIATLMGAPVACAGVDPLVGWLPDDDPEELPEVDPVEPAAAVVGLDEELLLLDEHAPTPTSSASAPAPRKNIFLRITF
jgi:hypothetical protein